MLFFVKAHAVELGALGHKSDVRPRSWLEFWDQVAFSSGLKRASFRQYLLSDYNDRLNVSWAPSFLTSASSFLGGSLCLVYWGSYRPTTSRLVNTLKALKHWAVVRGANRIIVNDRLAISQLPSMVQGKCVVLSHFVDANFFSPGKDANRKMILIPGDIDRDEQAALKFLELGFEVTRVTRENIAVPQGVVLKRNVSWMELRELYQNAILTVLPMNTRHHIGGQTSLLESLACGTPVLTNSTRLESRFGSVEGVYVKRALSAASIAQVMNSARRPNIENIKMQFGFDEVVQSYASIIRSLKAGV